jgi:hypothetical protein
MRTSGKSSDLPVLIVPLVVLIAVGVALAGDPGQFLSRAERSLWHVVGGVGQWVSSLF